MSCHGISDPGSQSRSSAVHVCIIKHCSCTPQSTLHLQCPYQMVSYYISRYVSFWVVDACIERFVRPSHPLAPPPKPGWMCVGRSISPVPHYYLRSTPSTPPFSPVTRHCGWSSNTWSSRPVARNIRVPPVEQKLALEGVSQCCRSFCSALCHSFALILIPIAIQDLDLAPADPVSRHQQMANQPTLRASTITTSVTM